MRRSRGNLTTIALIDFQMPEMDGQALARAIRSDPVIGTIRLVILTSHGQSLKPTELHELGIDLCLIKPIKQSRLFDCLSEATDRVAVQTSPHGDQFLSLYCLSFRASRAGLKICAFF